MKDILQRLKRAPVFWLILGLLPFGAVIPALLASLSGLCTGAVGSGITCHLGPLTGYIKGVLTYFELGFLLFGASLVWLGLSIWIWVRFFTSLIRQIRGTSRPDA